MRYAGFILSLTCIGLLCGLNSCNLPPKEERKPYAFFVAGHVYGAPGINNEGVHPPLEDFFPTLRDWPGMEFGFFAGDNVIRPSKEEFDEIDADIEKLGLPVHMVMGNHDAGDVQLFVERYGERYRSFRKNGDLFLILDPLLDYWNINGEQLEWVKEELAETPRFRNVFVVMHEMVWWERDNVFRSFTPNSLALRADSVNWWSEVEPVFHQYEGQVYLFSGDHGAFHNGKEVSYYYYDNMHYIATGMGGYEKDNLIVGEINEQGEVNLELIWLNGPDMNGLGKLEDFQLP